MKVLRWLVGLFRRPRPAAGVSSAPVARRASCPSGARLGSWSERYGADYTLAELLEGGGRKNAVKA